MAPRPGCSDRCGTVRRQRQPGELCSIDRTWREGGPPLFSFARIFPARSGETVFQCILHVHVFTYVANIMSRAGSVVTLLTTSSFLFHEQHPWRSHLLSPSFTRSAARKRKGEIRFSSIDVTSLLCVVPLRHLRRWRALGRVCPSEIIVARHNGALR